MTMGSVTLIKESVSTLIEHMSSNSTPTINGGPGSTFSLVAVIVIKILLAIYCRTGEGRRGATARRRSGAK